MMAGSRHTPYPEIALSLPLAHVQLSTAPASVQLGWIALETMADSTSPDTKRNLWHDSRRMHLFTARILIFVIFAQIGLGVIVLSIHRWLGLAIGLLAVLLAVTARRGEFTPSTTRLSIAFLALVIVQGLFIALADRIPVFGILHLINGFLLFGMAIVVAIESEGEQHRT